jgi:hypothetical protein
MYHVRVFANDQDSTSGYWEMITKLIEASVLFQTSRQHRRQQLGMDPSHQPLVFEIVQEAEALTCQRRSRPLMGGIHVTWKQIG